MKVIYKKLTKKGISLVIDNHEHTVESVDTVRIYNLFMWQKHLHKDKDCKAILPEFHSDCKNQVTLLIKPESCTAPLVFIEIYLKLKDTDDLLIIHTMFINEFSIFKAKSMYLEGLAGCKQFCSSQCGTCNNCKEYKDLLGLMTFMLRLSLLKDAYLYDNEELVIRYYMDLQRHVNMDSIPFTYIDTEKDLYRNPDRLHMLYHYLNHELKHNVSPCARRLFESLMLSDLYDILFDKMNLGNRNNWILEDSIWNNEDEYWYDNKIWQD